MREIKFNEDAQKILATCASILERQVYRLLEDDTRFVNAALDRVDESTNVSCENMTLTDFAGHCIRLFDTSDSRLNYLMHAFPTAKDNPPNDQVKANRKISVANKRKRQKSVNKVAKYSSLFIGSGGSLASENCFATVAMNTMSKTIDEIQTEAVVSHIL